MLLNEVLVWIIWFSMIGFLKLFSLLCRDRFEYLTTFSPNTRSTTYTKILFLLFSILVLDISWFYFCVTVFQQNGASLLLLLTFECFTLFLDTIQTLIKYGIHLVDLRRQGMWEQRGVYIYYTEFLTDSLILLATLGHYLQILVIHGLALTLIDAVLFLHIRIVFNNLREKITAYRNYCQLAKDMNERYENVSEEELEAYNDDCAICRERMNTAKRLPCSHIFHQSCLRSWLEQHHSCPTCRHSLIQNHQQPQQIPGNIQNPPPIQNHNYQFPAFEQNNRPLMFNLFPWGGGRPPGPQVEVENGVRSVQEIFPDFPPGLIAEDLVRTQSVEATTNNILEGRLRYLPDPHLNPNLNLNPHVNPRVNPNMEPRIRDRSPASPVLIPQMDAGSDVRPPTEKKRNFGRCSGIGGIGSHAKICRSFSR